MPKKSTQHTAVVPEAPSPDDKPVIQIKDTASFERWLDKHHTAHGGVWIRFFKAASGHAGITYAEALEVALCFGWIDGPIRKGDDVSWIHKFAPRAKRSIWSQVNKGHIERLAREGRMKPAGLTAANAAKADGRWDAAYASSSTFQESAEFTAALKKSKKGAAFYAQLSKAQKYSFYFRLHAAKKPTTKARKLNEFVTMLERGEVFH